MAGLLSKGLLLVAISFALAAAQGKAQAPNFLRDMAWWQDIRTNETKLGENLAEVTPETITERLTYLLPFIENADTDKDGKISMDDIWALAERLDRNDAKLAVSKFDANKDGKLSFKEYDRYFKKDMRKIWKVEFDVNKIALDKSTRCLEMLFSMADKDDDTWLSEEEIIPLLNPSLTGSPMQLKRIWFTKTPPKETAGLNKLKWEVELAAKTDLMCPSLAAESEEELIKLMDPDDDGYFSYEDFLKCREDVKKNQMATLWKALDQDGDSKISKEELHVDVSKAHIGMFAYDWLLALAQYSKLPKHAKHTEL